MRQIEIEWMEIGRTVTAELFDDTNRALGDLLWRCLPYSSVQTHALVSGEHLYHVAPIVELVTTAATYREDRTKSPDGTVFLSQLQHLAVKYGALSEYIPAAPVAAVLEADLPGAGRGGRRMLGQRSPDQTANPGAGAPRRRARGAVLFPVLRTDRRKRGASAARRCRGRAPPHLASSRRRRSSTSTPGASRAAPEAAGQWFSTLVFVNGETRPLGYAGFGGLMQVCRDPEISLDVLRRITRSFIRVPAEFLGYCGLRRLLGLRRPGARRAPGASRQGRVLRAGVGARPLHEPAQCVEPPPFPVGRGRRRVPLQSLRSRQCEQGSCDTRRCMGVDGDALISHRGAPTLGSAANALCLVLASWP